jgi:hypothetical protein
LTQNVVVLAVSIGNFIFLIEGMRGIAKILSTTLGVDYFDAHGSYNIFSIHTALNNLRAELF